MSECSAHIAHETHLTITLAGGNQFNLHGQKNGIRSRQHFLDAVGKLKAQAFQEAIQKAVRQRQTQSIMTPEQAQGPVMVPPMTSLFHTFVTLDGKEKVIDVMAIQAVEAFEAPLEELTRMRAHLDALIQECKAA